MKIDNTIEYIGNIPIMYIPVFEKTTKYQVIYNHKKTEQRLFDGLAFIDCDTYEQEQELVERLEYKKQQEGSKIDIYVVREVNKDEH